MSVAKLRWFDRLASLVIDPALRVVRDESKDGYPDYIIDTYLNPSPTRDRCLLTVTNRNVNRPQLAGALAIIAEPRNTLRVEQSYRWPGDGRTIAAAKLKAADVTEDKILSLARDFVAEMFSRVSKEE